MNIEICIKSYIKKRPKEFSFGYARSLVVGFVLFKFDKSVLDKAEEIIKEYKRDDLINSVTKTIMRLKSRNRVISD